MARRAGNGSAGSDGGCSGRRGGGLRSCHKGNRAENTFGLYLRRKYTAPLRQYAANNLEDTPGARLRKSRLEKDLTIAELAEATGMTTSNLNLIELNKTNASLPTLRKLARILEVEIAYLGCFENMPEETVGEQIAKARFHQGITKKELAELIKKDVKTVTNWENGKNQPGLKIKNLIRYIENQNYK